MRLGVVLQPRNFFLMDTINLRPPSNLHYFPTPSEIYMNSIIIPIFYDDIVYKYILSFFMINMIDIISYLYSC